MRITMLGLLLVAFSANATSGQAPPAKPKEAVQVEKDLSLKPVPISPKDDALLKLQKEKLNAVIAELNYGYELYKDGKVTFEGVTIAASGRLKDTVLELNDANVTMKTVNAYVELMEQAHKDTETRFKAGTLSPQAYYRERYYYFDAQILQLRVKKQLDGK